MSSGPAPTRLGEEVGGILVVLPALGDGEVNPRTNQFAPAISSFLEMYGFVAHECIFATGLSRKLAESRWAGVLVLNQSDWKPIIDVLEPLKTRAGALLIEGPICEEMAASLKLGVARAPASRFADVVEGQIRERLGDILRGYARADIICLEPIVSTVSRTGQDADGRKTIIEEAVDSPFHRTASTLQTFEGGDEKLLDIDGKAVFLRTGNALVSGFPIVNLICQRLGCARLPHPWRKATGERNGENLELLLLFALARVARKSGLPLVSMDPWPAGVRYPVTLRHDVDRPVEAADWERLLEWQNRLGVKPTWYYLAKNIDHERMAQTAKLGHEIAFHYTNLETCGADEAMALRRAAGDAGGEIAGMSCHGGNFHGARDIEWAVENKFDYSELLTRCSFFPFRPVYLENENVVASSASIFSVARHLSVDKKMTPPEADFNYGEQTKYTRQRLNAHAVIMNHPDINFEALASAYQSYLAPGVESWTQDETIKWWRASHAGEAVSVTLYQNQNRIGVVVAHSAPRPPVLRVWADVDACDALDKTDNLGEIHTLFKADPGDAIQFQTKPE